MFIQNTNFHCSSSLIKIVAAITAWDIVHTVLSHVFFKWGFFFLEVSIVRNLLLNTTVMLYRLHIHWIFCLAHLMFGEEKLWPHCVFCNEGYC